MDVYDFFTWSFVLLLAWCSIASFFLAARASYWPLILEGLAFLLLCISGAIYFNHLGMNLSSGVISAIAGLIATYYGIKYARGAFVRGVTWKSFFTLRTYSNPL